MCLAIYSLKMIYFAIGQKVQIINQGSYNSYQLRFRFKSDYISKAVVNNLLPKFKMNSTNYWVALKPFHPL